MMTALTGLDIRTPYRANAACPIGGQGLNG